MATNESVQFFLRFVKERQTELLKSLEELVHALVGEDPKMKKSCAHLSLLRATDLKNALSQQDIPDWLQPLIQVLTKFENGSNTTQTLIDFIRKNERSIKSHQWKVNDNIEQAFDFDSIFEHYKSNSRLPELFDQIIQLLEEIEASGEIDSISMLNALTKVIATLKKNKDGSFFSMNSAWSFVTSFLKHYFWAEISQIPVLGSVVQALQKAVEETNQELFIINSNVEQKMKETVEEEIRPLAHRVEFAFLAYDGKANEIPKSSNTTIDQKA